MSQSYGQELEAAIAAVRQAATITQAVQARLVSADTLQKRDKSPVTVADFASQAVVCHALARAFPNDPVVGEENAHALRSGDNAALRRTVVEQVRRVHPDADDEQVLDWIDRGGFDPAHCPPPAGRGGERERSTEGVSAGRYWTLDPIDGTKGFLRGEQYAIALALIDHGQLVLGVLGCPNLPTARLAGTMGTTGGLPASANVLKGAALAGKPPVAHDDAGVLMTAVRGCGATSRSLNDDETAAAVPVHVSDVADPAAARFCESVESGHSDQDQSARIAQRLGITADPVRMDSQAKYAAVARGDASIYLRLPTRPGYRENIWDHAAGVLVIEEAGGAATDVAGKPLDFSRGRRLEDNRGIVATNGRIHDAVVEAVKTVLGESTSSPRREGG